VRALFVLLAACAAEPSASITVSGHAAPNVDVVFRVGAREEIAKAKPDGTYKLVLPAGTYRVFVRDDSALSVGRMDRVRLPGLPGAYTAGALDESLIPEVTLTRDATDVDVVTVRGGIVTGTVFDVEARPVFNAVISAHAASSPRPALGTDIAISRYDGTFELRLPDGEYQLAASHEDFADATDVGRVDVKGGSHHVSLTLVKGCVVTGRVLRADGSPSGEGAIERRFGSSDLEFLPNGRIASDGTFRWTTPDEAEVVLRAWPWHAPPSPSVRFRCKNGAKHTTTFRIPDRPPDLSGTLVDKRGVPVPFAFLDVQPLDPGGIAQQERTDAAGTWSVFAMPPGRYAITTHTRGGVIAKVVTSPATNQRLELSGTGRIEGTTSNLVNGSFELVLAACFDGTSLQLARDPRLVIVRAGRFVVDDVPACDLELLATWRDESHALRTTVTAGGTARVQLDIGEPREKLVTGVVRDRGGRGVSHAHVTALYKKHATSAIAGEDGAFSITTYAGATLTADREGARGNAEVGIANVTRERVDILISR
jgi:hypothetical protein